MMSVPAAEAATVETLAKIMMLEMIQKMKTPRPSNPTPPHTALDFGLHGHVDQSGGSQGGRAPNKKKVSVQPYWKSLIPYSS